METIQLSSESVMYRSASGRVFIFVNTHPVREMIIGQDGVNFLKAERVRANNQDSSIKFRHPLTYGEVELQRNGNTVEFRGESYNKVVYCPSEVEVAPRNRWKQQYLIRLTDGQFLYVSRDMKGAGFRLVIGDGKVNRQLDLEFEQFRCADGSKTTIRTGEGVLTAVGDQITWRVEGEVQEIEVLNPLDFLILEDEQGVRFSSV